MRLKCYCHWETKCINDIDVYHITTIIFLCAGLQNKGVMILWHLEAAESRLHELEGHLRVTFQVDMLRPVFLAGWCYGKIVVGFLFGCKIDDVGEIRGFCVWKAPGFKEIWVPAKWQCNPYHYHHTLSQPRLDLQYLTWLTFYILLRWSGLNQLGEMQWMRMGPVRIGLGSWRHFRKTHGVRWKLHRHAMPCIGQGWTGMGWSGEWHI